MMDAAGSAVSRKPPAVFLYIFEANRTLICYTFYIDMIVCQK